MDGGHQEISCDRGGYRGRTDEVPFPKGVLTYEAGVQVFPKALPDHGTMLQEPIPENLVKFVIWHISSAVL